MADIKRKPNESFEAFMRRTKKTWQSSGKLIQAKKVQFFETTKSKNMRRKSALRRNEITEKMAYLRKIGRLPEEETRDRKW